MGRQKKNYNSLNPPKENGEVRYTRRVQITLTGKLLKEFDSEVAKFEDCESSVGRDLIRDGFRHRDALKNRKNPFFNND